MIRNVDPCLAPRDDHKSRGGPVDRDARVLRDRQAGLCAAIDRAPIVPATAAARRLVSVYNGGNMPTQPDYIFLTHPVWLDGSEVEGGPASPNVDTSATIPVVVLRGAPQVGDLLVASAVGGRWVAERSGSCTVTVCVVQCGTVPVYGAVVTILNSSETIVAQCTTGTGGCCQVSVCGTYTVQVTVGGTLVYGATRTLVDGQQLIVPLSSEGLVCCGGYAIPYNLTLTDAAGSLAFTFYPNYFYPIWYGGHAVTRESCSVTTSGGICGSNPPSEGPVKVCYQMICYAGQNPTFAIQRAWSWVYQQGTLTPIWYQDPSGFTPGLPCATAPPAICGSPLTDTASLGANPSSASPFVLSGTPVAASSNATADPIGGSITISA
jgi:hypothetical protein